MVENIKYKREIKGEYSLAQINLEIAQEEARGTEFLDSTVSFHKDRITNIANFKRLSLGDPQNKLILVKQDQAQPDNTVQVWFGVMIVDNKNEAVSAYRAT